ncbi:Ribokinase-like [Phytophthora cactorum]|nr:Ribokinase-like [Phytophthora cactorum]
MNLSAYVNHLDVAVREMALTQLLRCLLCENEGDIFIDRALASVVQSILQLSRTESHEPIKLLCARCLGALGAIDGARVPLNMFYTSGPQGGAAVAKEKQYQKVEYSTKDLAIVLIETWLVKELRAAPENTDSLAFAIQELLKFLAELTADPQHSGQSLSTNNFGSSYKSRQDPSAPMPEWMKRRFERKDVLQFVEPYWSTNYAVSGGRSSHRNGSSGSDHRSSASADRNLNPGRDDISFYEKYGTSYEDWILNWCRRLISLSQPPERKIFLACRTALPTCPQISRFLLPYLIQNVLRSGRSEVGEELKKEVMAVLDDQDCGILVDDVLMAPPESEHTNDSLTSTGGASGKGLNEWIWTSEKKRLALSASAASRQTSASGRSDVASEIDDDHEKEYLEEFLKGIPSRSLSNAAYQIKAYARAVQYFEVHLRQEEFNKTEPRSTEVEMAGPVRLSLVSKNATYLQQLLHCHPDRYPKQTAYSQLAMMQPPAQILDVENAHKDPDMIKPELYGGMISCLIQLGRLESALQHINGIVTQEPQFMATMYPYALECSWRLSRWELLTDLLSAEKQNPLLHSSGSSFDDTASTRLKGFDVSQLMLVRVLHSLHGGQREEFQRHLRAARLEVMRPLAAASAESYQRAYPLLHDLHFLHEAEQGFIFLQNAKECDDLSRRSLLWKKQTPWKVRYDAMATQLKYRDPILALRRVVLHEAGLLNEVSENWLLYAKLTRKEGFFRTAASAVMHAQAMDNQYAPIEKAKLLVSQDRVYEALQILEPVDIDASTLDFDVDDPHLCAKNLLLATNWMQKSGQRQGKKVIERYQAVIRFDPTWEKGYFFLAKYYEYLLNMSHPDALNGSMSSDEAADLLVDSVFHGHLISLMKNYVLALAHGTKFVFQSLPRLLTLWFDYGEWANKQKANKAMRQIEIGLSQSTNEHKVLTDITQVVDEAIESLPAYEWLVCFPQVTSRICHPNPEVVDSVKRIMIQVLLAYPTQAMWSLLGLSRSLNSQRRNRAREIISMHSSNSFSEGMKMAEELISLAAHDPGNSKRKIHIRLSRIRTRILVPIQAALTTILPTSGLAPRDEHHVAFSSNAQIYIKAFSDKADVMMTKEKPKRIEILGTDGQLYPFLCKREKNGDLRKDARMMEFNSMINRLLQKDREGRKRKLRLRTYAVVCLNEESGLMEWVRHTRAMRQLIGQIHKTERGYIQPVRLTHEIKEQYLNMQKKYANNPPAMARFYCREVLSMPVFTPRFHQWFYNNFADPTAWFEARLMFSRSAAVWSMVGHIVGLGDRHGENILIDCTNGECVHVDFDCLFDKGLKLTKPEIVPFRLTPNIIDAFGITGYEGVFRRVSEVTMQLLRENKATLRSVLESFIHDPLVEWGRRGKATQSSANSGKTAAELSSERSKQETRLVLKTIDDRLRGIYNLGDAIRPLVSSSHRNILPENETLPLSVQGQVDKLIHEATSHENLAQMTMEVIAVGTAAIDVVHEVAAYPAEDIKARSLATYKCRGGNAASALVVCSQLGGRCRWLSTSTDPERDSDAAFIHADLAAFNVDCSLAYILASRETGSRTIVHSRTIAELTSEAFAAQVERYLKEIRQNVNAPVWFHFEGRNMETVRNMMLHIREHAPQATISVEIEFPRYPWSLAKTLASLADFVFMSKDYLRDNIHISTAEDFFEGIRAQQWGEDWDQWVKAFICPWGAEGVYYLDLAGSTAHHIPAAQLDQVVESNGAGDSFIGATLAGLSCGDVPLHLVLKTACDVATVKCSQHGFKLPADKLLRWKQDLQLSEGSDDKLEEINFRTLCVLNLFNDAGTSYIDQDRNEQIDVVAASMELELERVEHVTGTNTDVFTVPLLPTIVEDTDGDIIVPRRQANKRRKCASRTTRTCQQRHGYNIHFGSAQSYNMGHCRVTTLASGISPSGVYLQRSVDNSAGLFACRKRLLGKLFLNLDVESVRPCLTKHCD